MTKNVTKLFIGILLLAGSLAFSAHADLGLSQILADQGVQAVGATVKTAAEAVYAGTDDPVQIQAQLVAFLNEAEATGDKGAMRYTIIAVMLAGGTENLDLSRSAINHSQLFVKQPDLTAFTVATAEALLSGGGDRAELGGGKEAGGGESEQGGDDQLGGGEDSKSLGGGDPNPFDPAADVAPGENSVAPFGKIRDRDSAATRI